ncbi:HAD-IA family hydrolase [Candidatus Woesearchaeota archaeon]|nr:HAD-IA family hydrolase [Candidatus Woesearchaeota archaeon]
MKKLLLFDLDGVLLDSSKAIVKRFNEAMTEFGYDEWEPQSIRNTIGRPLVEVWKDMDPDISEEKINQMLGFFRNDYLKLLMKNTEVYPGVIKTLHHLNQDHIMAIVTNKRTIETIPLIKAIGIYEFFTKVYGADIVSDPKPHPEMLQLALKELKIEKEDAIMIGDSVSDIKAAHSAGIECAVVESGFGLIGDMLEYEPEYILNTVEDLKDLFYHD